MMSITGAILLLLVMIGVQAMYGEELFLGGEVTENMGHTIWKNGKWTRVGEARIGSSGRVHRTVFYKGMYHKKSGAFYRYGAHDTHLNPGGKFKDWVAEKTRYYKYHH